MLAVKDARIEFKTTAEIKELLQKAATFSGMDLSSFLISVATQKAKEIIKEDRLLTLADSEWDSLEKYLNANKEPSDELKDLMSLSGFNE
jgi:uncharacterized protein (DUF1778 family)